MVETVRPGQYRPMTINKGDLIMTTTTTTNKSESIFTILENGQTSTQVKGEGYQTMLLPVTMPTAEQFETAEELVQWAEEQGITHAIMQKGIQKHLIDLRARFRLVKKGETWNITTAQENVDAMEWSVVTKPNQNSQAAVKAQAMRDAGIKMAQAMKAAKVDNTTILASLTAVYGADVASDILNSLN